MDLGARIADTSTPAKSCPHFFYDRDRAERNLNTRVPCNARTNVNARHYERNITNVMNGWASPLPSQQRANTNAAFASRVRTPRNKEVICYAAQR